MVDEFKQIRRECGWIMRMVLTLQKKMISFEGSLKKYLAMEVGENLVMRAILQNYRVVIQ